MTRVGVLGAAGRMGAAVCDAVAADDDLDLVARVDRDDRLEVLTDAGVEVAVDFTTPEAVRANVEFCLDHGIHAVVGTTGVTDDDLQTWSRPGAPNVFVAPNFAIGAVVMMQLAARAARHFDGAEIVERHHERKLDAPSGTSLRTAALMNEARRRPWATPGGGPGSRGLDVGGIRIHSMRIAGSVAHQEVVLGRGGETLTIRHDSLDRTSFMPGVLLAIKAVGELDGVVVGLENLLDL